MDAIQIDVYLHIWECRRSRLPLLWRVSLLISEAKVFQPRPQMVDLQGLPGTNATTCISLGYFLHHLRVRSFEFSAYYVCYCSVFNFTEVQV